MKYLKANVRAAIAGHMESHEQQMPAELLGSLVEFVCSKPDPEEQYQRCLALSKTFGEIADAIETDNDL